jgi:hypothetical protein
MATALSPENRIKEFLRSTDELSATGFCAIVGRGVLDQGDLSRALNDIKPLSSAQAEAALAAIAKLNVLLMATQPLPLSFKNPGTIRKLLSAMESNDLHINVKVSREAWDQAPE